MLCSFSISAEFSISYYSSIFGAYLKINDGMEGSNLVAKILKREEVKRASLMRVLEFAAEIWALTTVKRPWLEGLYLSV